jgi:hypothetical protein
VTGIDEYYELRMYQCAPGRIGDLHQHMAYRVPPVFKRHGVSPPLVNWEGFAGPMTPLYAYMLRWKNLDERMNAFRRFYADPDGQAPREPDGPTMPPLERIELMILRPSPAWAAFKAKAAPPPIDGINELRIQQISTRDTAAAHQTWGEVDLTYLNVRGATVLGVFASWYATGTPHIVTVLAWKDMQARGHAYCEYDCAPEIRKARLGERQEYGADLYERCDVHLMHPAWYGMPRANLAEPD